MKKYRVIYADPPWRYSFSKSKSRSIESHYQSMSESDICLLDVPSGEDSVLFLWSVAPKIDAGLRVLCAWGFEYKTQAIWDKKKLGMGYWFRGQHEILLVGTKGRIRPPEIANRVSSVFVEPRGRHSKKPDSVRRWIEQSFPSQDKLEMFARERHEGWDAFGNEVEGSIDIPILAHLRKEEEGR